MSGLRMERDRSLPTLPGVACLVLLIATLGGCALPPGAQAPAGTVADGTCGAEPSPADNTRLAGIDQLLREGKPHAALAQLDALAAQGKRPPQADLARADALRRIDRWEQAEGLYRGLLHTCLQGRAWHGLGLLQAQRGLQADSIASLERARGQLPTDARVRNDLGYALLLAQRFEDARFEFLTVLELEPGDARAARNLVLLTLREGRIDKARELAASLGLDAATLARLVQSSANMPALNPGAPTPEPASDPVSGRALDKGIPTVPNAPNAAQP